MKAGFFLAASAAGLALCSAFLAGCNDASKSPAPAPAPGAGQKATEKTTTARTVIEGVTGKTAVDQGLSARDKLRAVDTQRRKDMEALGP